jgi:hypothetical protein
MTTKTKTTELTAAAQVAELRRLRPAAAAALLGVSARTLRDRVDLPRTDDGRFDATVLFRAAAGQATRPRLTDQDTEVVFRIADAVFGDLGAGAPAAVLRGLDRLCRTHGDAVLLVLTDRLIDLLRDRAATAEILAEFDAQEVRDEIERRRAAHAERAAADNLDIAVVCQDCRKIRQGARWVKGSEPRHSVYGICPGCISSDK